MRVICRLYGWGWASFRGHVCVSLVVSVLLFAFMPLIDCSVAVVSLTPVAAVMTLTPSYGLSLSPSMCMSIAVRETRYVGLRSSLS